MGIRSLNRWQAVAWHPSASLMLGLAVLVLFRFLWYPGALFTLAGAGKLLLLVVGIDVVVGPLLTLIVFNPRKKSLIWDLVTILAVQITALGYGVWVMAQSRPVFLVGATDRFELVTANQIRPEDLAEAPKREWRRLPWTGPMIVGARPPADPDQRLNLALQALEGGPDVTHMPQLFVPLPDVVDMLLSESRALADFEPIAPEEVDGIREWLRGRNFDESSVAVLPLKARGGMGAVVIDRASAMPLRTALFDGYGSGSNEPDDSKSEGNGRQSSTASQAEREGLPIGTAYASMNRHGRRAGLGARDPGQPPVPRT